MNGPAALPAVPESAIDGVPPAADLPTVATRRRFAQALAAALAGERSYEISVWPAWDVPVLLKLRAMQEDWPVIGTAGVATLMQPAPLPAEPWALFERAVNAVPVELTDEVGAVLEALWAGDVPAPSAKVQVLVGAAIMRAGFRAHDEALELAEAADPVVEGRRVG